MLRRGLPRLRLARLQRLLLCRVFLRQLLRLLLVLLLHLLRPGIAGPLLRELLMLRFLFLLQLLPLLVLIRDQFLLLLLVFLVRPGISRAGRRGAGNRRKVIGMNYSPGRSVLRLPGGRFSVQFACRTVACGSCRLLSPRWFRRSMVVHWLRFRRGCNGRLAVIHARTLLRVGASGLDVFGLCSNGWKVPLL